MTDDSVLNENNLVGWVFAGYRVEQKLGAGGMGVVYRATDIRLRRPAALKFVLASALDSRPARNQVLREAQAAAALNHPNICTIYGVGEEQGRLFIAMELLEGSDVRKLLTERPLRWTQAVSIFQQAGRALEEAHAHNVIHRDVKASNIFVTRQRLVKLLDFGIAARTDDPDETRTVAVPGTPAYLAPEQIEFGMTDGHTDLWALTVVLYEMLTGKMPFRRDGGSSLKSILNDEPASPSAFASDIPPAIDKIVLKALAKKREDRYLTFSEMIADLERAATPTGTELTTHLSRRTFALPDLRIQARTIAVLPFASLSADPNDEYICDGLAEELIDGLTQIQSLRVVSRSSSFHFKGQNADIREVGRSLRASHIVHGSLRRSGDRLRLTAQLSEARDGYQLWSQRFDTTLKDLFTLQDELSAAILQSLRLRLTDAKALPAWRNAEAHDDYLRARFLFNMQTADALRESIDCLQHAIHLDPDAAPAHIALAECYATLEWYGAMSTQEAIPPLKDSLEKGLALDPDSAPGLCLLATVQAGYDWDWELAERTFRNALAVGSGFAAVLFHYALDLLTPLERLEQALQMIRNALELDPLSAITHTALGGCYYRLRHYDEAAAQLRRTLEANPNFAHAHWSLGRVLLEQSQFDAALRHFDEAERLMGPTPAALAERAYALARAGRKAEAATILAQLRETAKSQFVSPLTFALILTGLGDVDAAVSSLNEAVALRVRQLVWINVDPRFEPLKIHDGFSRILAELGITPHEPAPTPV